jgi:hypothetical protein
LVLSPQKTDDKKSVNSRKPPIQKKKSIPKASFKEYFSNMNKSKGKGLTDLLIDTDQPVVDDYDDDMGETSENLHTS